MMSKPKAKSKQTEVDKPYKAKPSELAAIQAYRAARAAKTPRPAAKIVPKGDSMALDLDHPDPSIAVVLLDRALGTIDAAFSDEMLSQLANASGRGSVPNEKTLNFMLAVIDGISPRDQVEAMLAAQMAAVHCAMMTFTRRLNHVDNIMQQDAAERAFNKLARTFAVQMEALKRYRTGGEQKVTVQHVHVNDGGQAIVGTVAPIRAEGGGAEKQAPSP